MRIIKIFSSDNLISRYQTSKIVIWLRFQRLWPELRLYQLKLVLKKHAKGNVQHTCSQISSNTTVNHITF